MAKELNLEEVERQARQVLDTRIESVRTLVTARQKVAQAREDLNQAEREDVLAYNAAVAAGWTPEELRKLKLGEPEKKARVRRRAASRTRDEAQVRTVETTPQSIDISDPAQTASTSEENPQATAFAG
jgi:hypothetical protein